MFKPVLRQIRRTGIIPYFLAEYSKAFTLPAIGRIRPVHLPSSSNIGIHMLLPHCRVLEGMWTLYSLFQVSDQTFSVYIHDDGSLNSADHLLLEKAFPGIRIVSRGESDAKMKAAFGIRRLDRCAQFRQQSVFALKLFDVCEFGDEEHILLLDCDVLFFRYPGHLLENQPDIVHLYQRDYQRAYCLAEDSMLEYQGPYPVQQLNPGIMRIHRRSIDFRRIERYLSTPLFYTANGSPDYYAELTSWALEVSHQPNSELPPLYGMNTSPWVAPETIAGHFCGGGFWASTFYSKGIRVLSKRVGFLTR